MDVTMSSRPTCNMHVVVDIHDDDDECTTGESMMVP
jgi:hypothetical protein